MIRPPCREDERGNITIRKPVVDMRCGYRRIVIRLSEWRHTVARSFLQNTHSIGCRRDAP
jgi:hypothetical protein